MKTFLRIAAGLVILLFLGLMLLYAAGEGLFASPESVGEIVEQARPEAEVRDVARSQEVAAQAVGVSEPKQVLFGDFHVHTTFSFDAFNLRIVRLIIVSKMCHSLI